MYSIYNDDTLHIFVVGVFFVLFCFFNVVDLIVSM